MALVWHVAPTVGPTSLSRPHSAQRRGGFVPLGPLPELLCAGEPHGPRLRLVCVVARGVGSGGHISEASRAESIWRGWCGLLGLARDARSWHGALAVAAHRRPRSSPGARARTAGRRPLRGRAWPGANCSAAHGGSEDYAGPAAGQGGAPPCVERRIDLKCGPFAGSPLQVHRQPPSRA